MAQGCISIREILIQITFSKYDFQNSVFTITSKQFGCKQCLVSTDESKVLTQEYLFTKQISNLSPNSDKVALILRFINRPEW